MSEPMIAVEFQTQIKNGTIEIPEDYRAYLTGDVRVIILRTDPAKKSKIIQRLLEHPIEDPLFQPMKREEIYER
jgi:hypothetical protein